MVGINVPIPVPVAYHSFGGWKRSGFGDISQYGMEGVRFWTKNKTVTQRWPDGGAARRKRLHHPDHGLSDAVSGGTVIYLRSRLRLRSRMDGPRIVELISGLVTSCGGGIARLLAAGDARAGAGRRARRHRRRRLPPSAGARSSMTTGRPQPGHRRNVVVSDWLGGREPTAGPLAPGVELICCSDDAEVRLAQRAAQFRW